MVYKSKLKGSWKLGSEKAENLTENRRDRKKKYVTLCLGLAVIAISARPDVTSHAPRLIRVISGGTPLKKEYFWRGKMEKGKNIFWKEKSGNNKKEYFFEREKWKKEKRIIFVKVKVEKKKKRNIFWNGKMEKEKIIILEGEKWKKIFFGNGKVEKKKKAFFAKEAIPLPHS